MWTFWFLWAGGQVFALAGESTLAAVWSVSALAWLVWDMIDETLRINREMED